MKEWLIKYKREGYDYTVIYECGLEKASKVWEHFKANYFWDRFEEGREELLLEDIRKI